MAKSLITEAAAILRACPVVALSTVHEGEPRARYVVVGTDDGLTLWTATFGDSRKVAEIRAEPRVHVLGGYDPAEPNGPWVALSGRAEVLADPETRRANWTDSLKVYFSGPEDENYVVLKIVPDRLEYNRMGADRPEVVDLSGPSP